MEGVLFKWGPNGVNVSSFHPFSRKPYAWHRSELQYSSLCWHVSLLPFSPSSHRLVVPTFLLYVHLSSFWLIGSPLGWLPGSLHAARAFHTLLGSTLHCLPPRISMARWVLPSTRICLLDVSVLADCIPGGLQVAFRSPLGSSLRRHVVLIGGLTDGLLPTSYVR